MLLPLRWQWKNLGTLLRRAHKDRRALRALLWLAGVAVYVICYTIYFIRTPGALVSILVMAPFVAVVLWLITRSKRADAQSLLKLSTPTPLPDAADETAYRPRLQQQLCLEAGWATRAVGEAVLKQAGRDGDGSQTALRSQANEMLRVRDLWTALDEEGRLLMMAPEGSWDLEQIHRHTPALERARALLWMLGLEPLPPLSLEGTPEIRPCIAICQNPALVDRVAPMVPSYDIRLRMHECDRYFTRCYWELAHRAQQGETFDFLPDDRARAFLEEFPSVGAVDENTDLLLGAKSVGEADTEHVSTILSRAFTRYWTFRGILDYLEGPAEALLRLTPAAAEAHEDENHPDTTRAATESPA